MNSQPSSSEARHVAVLPAAVLSALAIAPGQTVVDATVGAGGHARLLAQAVGPAGRLIGLDMDPAMIDLAGRRLDPRICPTDLVQTGFDRLRDVLDELGVEAVDAVLADLGVCSDQLETPERGFSFQNPGPLDMRLNQEEGAPAVALLRRLNERDLADLFWKFGEERFSRRIAKKIVATRKRQTLETTEQLADLVRSCVPYRRSRRKDGSSKGIDPATRVFQALRIAVNDELGALERLLSQLPECLKPGGRGVIISFHSLEDRLVKHAFRDRRHWQVLTPKPVSAGEEEVRNNPRARSAKLRAAKKEFGDYGQLQVSKAT